MPQERSEERLSDQLEEWLASGSSKTMGDLVERFGPHSFAIVFVVLMAFPALPLPTGGLSHVLEVATMLLALELVIGRTEVWLPRRWQDRELRALSGSKFTRALLRRIRWFERLARPRMSGIFDLLPARVVFGVAVLVLSVTAFFAPPFSGLDTLPSLGVVVLSLGVLFGDVVIAGIGLAIGAAGVAVVVGLGQVIVGLF